MKRILIMGLPGAGKTFLAKALKQYLEDNGDLMKINPQRVLSYEGIPGPNFFKVGVDWFNADDIRKKYTTAINYRVGGELVLDEFRLRGGFASYGSPFLESTNTNQRSDYVTGGLGIKDKTWALDFGLVHTLGKDVFQPYVLNDNSRPQAIAENKFSGNTMVITFTSKF